MRWDAIIKRLPIKGKLAGAEIGVFEGITSLNILQQRPNIKKHYMVDPYIAYDDIKKTGEKTGFSSKVDTCEAIEIARFKASDAVKNYNNRVVIVYKSSVDAAEIVPDQTLDYVFIDATHDYENALADIKAWLPKVKPGGWIGGHNYNDGHYGGVTEAVRFYFAMDTIEEDEDWTWFVKVEK